MVRRGDVYLARLSPTQGSEQAGTRPVVVVSRDAINQNSPVAVVVPLSGREHRTRIYPSQVVLPAGEAGLTKDSVALCEQVRAISHARLEKYWGSLTPQSMTRINAALKITLDLP